MKKKRLIPVLLIKDGLLVQSREFRRHQVLGNPTAAVKRLSQWACDELIYLDISKTDSFDIHRTDTAGPKRQTFLDIIKDVSERCFMPIAVGGRIRTLIDIEKRLAAGADKICLNSIALENPDFITSAAREFGSQCVVISIDYINVNEARRVAIGGRQGIPDVSPIEWAKKVEDLGAGEILLNSVDRDGMKCGYDLETISQVADSVNIPVIACGGVGNWEHFHDALTRTAVDAVAAANIFHYSDQSVFLAKKFLFERGLNVRSPALFEF